MNSQKPGDAKDPVVAVLLSVCLPGLGYAYVSRWTGALVTLAVVVGLFVVKQWMFMGGFWLVQVVMAAGAVRRWNREFASDLRHPVPPPMREVETEPDPREEPPPPPVPVAVYVDSADEGYGTAPEAVPVATAQQESEPEPTPEDDDKPTRRRMTGPRLDPEQFLSMLRAAWNDHLAGRASEEEFVALKKDLIARVHAHGIDEGTVLMEKASELVREGVITYRERSRLQWQSARP